ncbi:MAG: hypothetical protein AAFV51_14835, partial [Pseudomonadota bacterium]
VRAGGELHVLGDVDQNRARAAMGCHVEALERAERPILYTGGGVINSGDQATAHVRTLAEATGFVTVLKGPGNADGAAWADVRYLGITADANTSVAQEFVEFVVSEGYGDWLSQAPEGKFPVRRGAEEGDTSYEEMWAALDVGVDRKAPLADIYPKEVIDDIVAGLSVGDRWGAATGQLATASKLVNSRVMSR